MSAQPESSAAGPEGNGGSLTFANHLMLRRISWAFLFLFAVGLRAESVSLGEHGSLVLAVPDGWETSSRQAYNPALEKIQSIHLTPKNGANSLCFITVVFAAHPKPIDKAAIERQFRTFCENFVPTSVEKKTNLKELPLSPAYGICATFTDAKLVGTPPQAGNFKVMTHAMIQFAEEVSATVIMLTDDEHGAEQHQLMQMVSAMKLVR